MKLFYFSLIRSKLYAELLGTDRHRAIVIPTRHAVEMDEYLFGNKTVWLVRNAYDKFVIKYEYGVGQ